MKERLDIGQVILCVAAFAFMAFLLKFGPEDQRGTIYAAAVGLITTVAAALRGRLFKRTPDEATKMAAHKAGEKAEKAVVAAVDEVEEEHHHKGGPETD